VEGKRVLEQKVEREWKSILCPAEKEKTWVMVEWDLISEKGRILKRTLKQIDCHHSRFIEFGEADCQWGCEGVIEKRER
jgi:hypothetical protein